jgi:hypothetical protein
MALTNAPTDKFKYAGEFSERLEPIIKSLNDLLKEYEITDIENTILLKPHDGEIVPFISYEAFPSERKNGLIL